MGFYAKKIYPWILDHTEPKDLASLRRLNLEDVKGEILEIGIGTGGNLPFYPNEISSITAVEPSQAMRSRAQIRASKSQIIVDWYDSKGEMLPFPNNSFDTVVSAGVLCSVDDVDIVLSELFRVLKPRGRFHFLEHGISKDEKIKKLQKKFNGLNKLIACGCNLTRNIENYLRISQFEIIVLSHIETFSGIDKLYPPIHGIALKNTAQ